MAGTVSAASPNLASELLLNKIMNGQVQTSTGASISSAGRAVSQSLSSDAYTARVAKVNMDYGATLIGAAQNELSSLKDKLTDIRKKIQDVSGNASSTTTLKKSIMAEASAVYAAATVEAAGAKYNGKLLVTGAAVSLNAGNGTSISVLGKELAAVSGKVKSGITAIGTAKTSAVAMKAAITALDDAINELIAKEASASDQIKQVQNRGLLLSDQGANLDVAASSQSVGALSGASNLLSSMLGGNTSA